MTAFRKLTKGERDRIDNIVAKDGSAERIDNEDLKKLEGH